MAEGSGFPLLWSAIVPRYVLSLASLPRSTYTAKMRLLEYEVVVLQSAHFGIVHFHDLLEVSFKLSSALGLTANQGIICGDMVHALFEPYLSGEGRHFVQKNEDDGAKWG